jgi:hypothetical protein
MAKRTDRGWSRSRWPVVGWLTQMLDEAHELVRVVPAVWDENRRRACAITEWPAWDEDDDPVVMRTQSVLYVQLEEREARLALVGDHSNNSENFPWGDVVADSASPA